MRAYKVFRQNSGRPVLMTCEHASRVIPRRYGLLGVKRKELSLIPDWHDVGAAELARALSRSMGSFLIMPRYSRMLINVNKPVGHPGLINPSSFGFSIKGNQDITEEERLERIRRYHEPYHLRVRKEIERLRSLHQRIFLISVHSFFYEAGGERRETPDIGVLYRYSKDQDFCTSIKGFLERRSGLCVEFNQPYSAHRTAGYAINTHGRGREFRCVEFEVNDRHLRSPESIERMGRLLSDALRESMERAT